MNKPMATHMRLRGYFSALTLALLCVFAAIAQGQWVVTVTPRNPLPIGGCGQVGLRAFDPKVKGTPHTAAGHYVSTGADFEMKVESSDKTAVVGRYESASIWVVCACLSAVGGSTATVTATYPAKALPEKLRVPDVTAQGTATFSIVAPSRPGSYNPPGCAALQLPTASTTRAGTTSPSGTATPISTPVSVTSRPSTIAPAGAPTSTTSAPKGPTESTAAPGTTTKSGTVIGPGPANVRILPDATPVFQELAWDRPAGISGYNVWIKPSSAATQWTQLNSALLTSESFPDATVRAPGVVYRVTATYSDGREGNSMFTYSNPPQMKVPTGFTAKEIGVGKAELSWTRVPLAKSYRVMGPGRPADGTVVTLSPYATDYQPVSFVIDGLQPGTYTWQVTADYGGAYQTAGMPSASVTIYSARFRVSILGFKVLGETGENQLSNDGKGNEVYAAGVTCTGLVPKWVTLNVAPAPPPYLRAPFPDCRMVRSAIHGDINGFPGRVKAGSGSASGGLVAGDLVGPGPNGSTAGSTTTFPFLLWEGDLLPDSQAVWIAPSLWESNGSDAELNDWTRAIESSLGITFGPPANFSGLGWSDTMLMSPGFVTMSQGVCASQKYADHPLGLSPPAYSGGRASLVCNMIGLTREKALAVLSASPQESGSPAGVLKMDLIDSVSGHYWMYLKLEQIVPPPPTIPIAK